MKSPGKKVNRLLVGALASCMLLSPLVARDAAALLLCYFNSNPGQVCGNCGANQASGQSCVCAGGSAGTCFGSGTPEMSDYLATAFVIVAGGMLYYIRRRATAKT
jgi:hypothetical protein